MVLAEWARDPAKAFLMPPFRSPAGFPTARHAGPARVLLHNVKGEKQVPVIHLRRLG